MCVELKVCVDRNFHDAVATVGKKNILEGGEAGITRAIDCWGVSYSWRDVKFAVVFQPAGTAPVLKPQTHQLT